MTAGRHADHAVWSRRAIHTACRHFSGAKGVSNPLPLLWVPQHLASAGSRHVTGACDLQVDLAGQLLVLVRVMLFIHLAVYSQSFGWYCQPATYLPLRTIWATGCARAASSARWVRSTAPYRAS